MRLYVVLTAAVLLCACATNGTETGSNGAMVVAEAAPSEPAATVAPAASEAAAEAPAAAESSIAKDGKDPNKIRCKYMPVTGSRMGRKVCHTVAEWEQMEKAAQEYMREINRQPTGTQDPNEG